MKAKNSIREDIRAPIGRFEASASRWRTPRSGEDWHIPPNRDRRIPSNQRFVNQLGETLVSPIITLVLELHRGWCAPITVCIDSNQRIALPVEPT